MASRSHPPPPYPFTRHPSTVVSPQNLVPRRRRSFSQRPTQCTATTTTTTKASVVQRPALCDFTLVLPSPSDLYTHKPTHHPHIHTPTSTGVRCSRAQCRVNRVRVTTAAVVEVTPAVRSARFVHYTPGAVIVADRSPRPLASHPERTQVSRPSEDAFHSGVRSYVVP